jgi:glyoxylase-like metal-dependent hydrolase (beta-lactamase superfamily II)
MMTVEIYTKRLGINFVYIIKGDGCIMIDVGPSFAFSAVKDWFNSLPINPGDINLVIITHSHFDHAGAIADVKDLTGAQVAIHEKEQEMLRTGHSSLPTPTTTWGRISLGLMKPLDRIFEYPGVEPDLIIGDEGLALDDYGIRGKIIHTPGHTDGSLSVLLEDGTAFVGCMTHNAPPFRLSPKHPIFADDLDQLWSSWKVLLDQGAKEIYPGHGRPFPVKKIQSQMKARV